MKSIIRRYYRGIDGAEVCELIGSFLIYQLSNKYKKKNIGLNKDDGLAVFKTKSGPKAERVKVDFQKTFWENDLTIVIKCNLKIGDYLHVTLNLLNSTYKPLSKPKKESNHPPSIITQVPFSIESRLSSFPQVRKFLMSLRLFAIFGK